MNPDEIRARLVTLFRGGFPRTLPAVPPGRLQSHETLKVGFCRGHVCSACEATIEGTDADLSVEYHYPTLTVHFHPACQRLWDDERHKLPRDRE
jgi:hypothetical protein